MAWQQPINTRRKDWSKAFNGNEKATIVGHNSVQLYGTTVFELDNQGNVHLATGGHRTVTTKRRINQAAKHFGIPLMVIQKKRKWIVITSFARIPFSSDRLTIKGMR